MRIRAKDWDMANVKTRILGIGTGRPLEVSAVGLGCMGFSHGYGAGPDHDESIELIRAAYEMGYSFFDTAEGYADGTNESLVGEAIEPFRDQVVVATKLHVPERGDEAWARSDLYSIMRSHLEASLSRLHTDHVELYYQHRMNETVTPVEVAEVMGRFIDEGLIGGYGQSQSTPDEIASAHEIVPMMAVQSEFSMMERMFEAQVIPLCGRLGIGFVPFSPMGAGFLSGAYAPREQSEYVGDDVRRGITRFSKANMEANQPILDMLDRVAATKGCTKAQVALAWMLEKYDFLVPIPGARRISRMEENLGATRVHLNADEVAEIDEALAHLEVHGNRTDEDILALYV